MQMNLVIQQRRKELGMTQEQVAEYLGVSTPAVSKWETGATNPDISLLPILARLLKIDVNTLFCFHEDISKEEISLICKQIVQVFNAQGFPAAYDAALEKLREYPHNESLRHSLAVQLESYLRMSPMSEAEREPYLSQILAWYECLAQSIHPEISSSAKFLLAGSHIRRGDYDKAQEVLDTMPEWQSMAGSMADKLMLQVTIYQHQGKTDQAVKELQHALLMAAEKVQLILVKLMDAELVAGNLETAKIIAEKSSQLPGLLDLWKYGAYTAPLQIALWEKDADQSVALMKQMLHTMEKPYDLTHSALFYRLPMAANTAQMIPIILEELKKDSVYDFLRDNEPFQTLISSYN